MGGTPSIVLSCPHTHTDIYVYIYMHIMSTMSTCQGLRPVYARLSLRACCTKATLGDLFLWSRHSGFHRSDLLLCHGPSVAADLGTPGAHATHPGRRVTQGRDRGVSTPGQPDLEFLRGFRASASAQGICGELHSRGSSGLVPMTRPPRCP